MAHRTTSARSKSTVIVGERSLDVADLEVIELEGLTAKDPAEIAKLLEAAESQGFFYLSFDNSLSKKISEFLRISYLNSHEFFSKPLDEKMKAFREDVNYGYVKLHTHHNSRPTDTHTSIATSVQAWNHSE